VSGELTNTDYIMRNTIFIGVYPGIQQIHMDYILSVFNKFFNSIH